MRSVSSFLDYRDEHLRRFNILSFKLCVKLFYEIKQRLTTINSTVKSYHRFCIYGIKRIEAFNIRRNSVLKYTFFRFH